MGRGRGEAVVEAEAQLAQQECAAESGGLARPLETHQRRGLECGGRLGRVGGEEGNDGGGNGYVEVSKREAFLFVAAAGGAEARDLGCESVEEPHVENEEPCGTSVPHGGAIGEEIGHGLRLVLSQTARQAGQVAGHSGDCPHDRACGVLVLSLSKHRMLKYKVEYETINIEEYEAKYKEQQIK